MNKINGFTSNKVGALPLYVLQAEQLASWLVGQSTAIQSWLKGQRFSAAAGELLLLPGAEGVVGAVLGVGDMLDPYAYSHAPFGLPEGAWVLATELAEQAQATMQLGWGLGSYRFSRYKKLKRQPAQLVATVDEQTQAILAACVQVRDWVNTPTEDMGPDDLEAIAKEMAQSHGAGLEVIAGDELLKQNFPAIHAVGRASHRAPRLLVLRWGKTSNKHVALVGKGVCFDTGGLDLKPADGMRNMKKDMGGAAHALALAGLVMAQGLPVQLTLLVAAVENAVGPDALRPGEVIATRKGTTVEIDNTDAEGRVILGDALTYASELNPDLIIDFATLTGAARVALGPDLPALFSNQKALAQDWLDAGEAVRDPLWQMPLWRPYQRYLNSGIADMANAGSRMAGAVTAALYLEHFIDSKQAWAHVDVYAWNDSDRVGRPAGGEALSLRSGYEMLKKWYAK